MRISLLADSVIVSIVIVLMGLSRVSGQAVPESPATPAAPTLQAELLKTIDATHARVGDEVTAKTDVSIEFGGVEFPPRSLVLGHIAQAEPGRLLLVFDRIAVGKDAPVSIGLSLRAVMMPRAATTKHPDPQSPGDQISPRAEAGGAGTGVDQAIQNPGGRGDMLRSPDAAAQDSANTVFQGPRSASQPQSVETRNGGVIGLPGIHLSVSTDPKAGAVFQADKNQKLKLEKGLLVIFVVSK